MAENESAVTVNGTVWPPAPSGSRPEPTPAVTREVTGYRDLTGLTIVTSVLLGLAALAFATIGFAVKIACQIDDDPLLPGALPGFACIFASLFNLVPATLFLRWTYCAYANLEALGYTPASSPEWAFGYFLLPIGSIFMPYLIFNEIWRGSKPDLTVTEMRKTDPVIALWWVSFLFFNVCTYIIPNYVDITTIAIAVSYAGVALLSAVLTILVMWRIRARQRARRALFDMGPVEWSRKREQDNVTR